MMCINCPFCSMGKEDRECVCYLDREVFGEKLGCNLSEKDVPKYKRKLEKYYDEMYEFALKSGY